MAKYPDYTNASCAGINTELFFDWSPTTYGMLRRLCLGCPVLQECREWAIAHEEYGFWGGMSPIERHSERVVRGVRLQTPTDEVMVRSGGGFYARGYTRPE